MNFVTGTLIAHHANEHRVPAELAQAMVQVESSGDPCAWNPEPHYRYLWDVAKKAPFRKLTEAEIASERPPADFPFLAGDRDQEWWAQQASWGAMQVMGAVAREHGLRTPYLTILCADPGVGLHYGCLHLATLYKRHQTWPAAVRAYNTGSPAESPLGVIYWDKVFRIAGKAGWRP